MAEIPDQRPIWDEKHSNSDHDILRNVPSPLAELAEEYFPRKATILELGCGVGRDAVFFSEHDHRVIATDGSKVVIEQNRKEITDTNIEFAVQDMRQSLPYNSEQFDVVYANLSLHYYDYQKTTQIIREITRVLRKGGVFAFACKSYDSLHGEGQEIEPSVFVSPTGATIHLFSQEYAESLIEQKFKVLHLNEVDEEFNGRYSRIVRVLAERTV